MKPSDQMRQQLKLGVIAKLRELGFKGSFPHFRRVHEHGLDLILFQFYKSLDGLSFCVEYGYTGRFVSWHGGPLDQMPRVTEKNVTCRHLDLKYRCRLNPNNHSAKHDFEDYWFKFSDDKYVECDEEVTGALPIAELWFKKMATDPANKQIGFTGTLALRGITYDQLYNLGAIAAQAPET